MRIRKKNETKRYKRFVEKIRKKENETFITFRLENEIKRFETFITFRLENEIKKKIRNVRNVSLKENKNKF